MKRKCRAKVTVKVLGSLLAGVTILPMTMANIPAFAEFSNYNLRGLKATTLEEVLALPDEEIDLATAILILSKEWDASFDVTGSLKEIDRMALELTARISPGDPPRRIVSLINQYLFEENTYSVAGFDLTYDPEMSALPCVLETKQGDCLGLSVLYLSLTERLGLPFYGVALPEHIFVRYDDGEERINIETTDKGRRSEDSYYEKKYMPNLINRKHNFYLRNLSKRELVGSFLNNFGVVYSQKGMYEEAISKLRRAIEINPNYSGVYNNLGIAYLGKGMHDEAIVEFERALEISPSYAEVHRGLGIAYSNKAMYDEATVELGKALAINSDDAHTHYVLGMTYHRMGTYNEAITEFKMVLGINPHYFEVHRGLGIAYSNKAMYDEATVELGEALAINPDDAEVHYNLGLAYHEKGMHDKEIEEYKKAIESSPDYFDPHCNLGIEYHGRGMYAEAIVEFKRAIEINSRDAGVHFNLGSAYDRNGMFNEAITEYKSALEINPNFAKAYNNLAIVYYIKREYVLAIEYCDKAIELGCRVHPQFLEDLRPYREK